MRRLKIVLAVLFVMVLWPATAQAASGTITFSTDTPQPVCGGVFTVVCQVSSTEMFVDADFHISYDAKLLSFVKGGSKVSGGDGSLHVVSTGNKTAVSKRTFSLQFKAKKVGASLIEMSESALITDANQANVSVSSNQLSIQVVETAAPAPSDTPAPQTTLSNSNRLKTMLIDAESMTPEFDSKVYDYQVVVDASTTSLLYHVQSISKKARVRVEGNLNLKEGPNPVTVLVTSESGKVRKYNLAVTKESEAQTQMRLSQNQAEKENVVFHANQSNGTITLETDCSFTVLKMVNENQLPAGYAATKMTLDGVSVPVYALENDLENDFVLLYLQGPAGKQGLYRYDRQEKTIQRYVTSQAGSTNKNETRTTSMSGNSGSIGYFVIIGILSLLVLGLLITLIKVLIQKKSSD